MGQVRSVVLVDTMNLAFRSAFTFPDLHDAAGRGTGVLYGALRAVMQLREQIAPHIIFAWDGEPGTHETQRSWRKAMFPSYKESRAAKVSTEPDMRPVVWDQLKDLKHVLDLIGVPSCGAAGLEADDIISLLCKQLVGYRKLIFSTDRDMYQLLAADTEVVIPAMQNKAYRHYRVTDLQQEYGLSPTQWPAYLAMGGDQSDSIKPQRGMGPKTAQKLIAAGAQPHLNWGQQSAEFRNGAGKKYQDCWRRVNLCYQMAALPNKVSDFRIMEYLFDLRAPVMPEGISNHLRVVLKPPDRSHVDAFTTWCADHAMSEFLSNRWKFFSPTGRLS